MTKRFHLRGSSRPTTVRATAPVKPSERLTVTVYVQRDPQGTPAPAAHELGRLAPGARSYLRPEEAVAAFGAAPSDIEAVAAFAQAHGLKVVERSIARRVVRVAGTAEQMGEAFGVQLGALRAPRGGDLSLLRGRGADPRRAGGRGRGGARAGQPPDGAHPPAQNGPCGRRRGGRRRTARQRLHAAAAGEAVRLPRRRRRRAVRGGARVQRRRRQGRLRTERARRLLHEHPGPGGAEAHRRGCAGPRQPAGQRRRQRRHGRGAARPVHRGRGRAGGERGGVLHRIHRRGVGERDQGGRGRHDQQAEGDLVLVRQPRGRRNEGRVDCAGGEAGQRRLRTGRRPGDHDLLRLGRRRLGRRARNENAARRLPGIEPVGARLRGHPPGSEPGDGDDRRRNGVERSRRGPRRDRWGGQPAVPRSRVAGRRRRPRQRRRQRKDRPRGARRRLAGRPPDPDAGARAGRRDRRSGRHERRRADVVGADRAAQPAHRHPARVLQPPAVRAPEGQPGGHNQRRQRQL